MKRYPLLAFLALTYLLSWSAWLLVCTAARGTKPLGLGAAYWQIAGEMGPGLAALIVAAGCEGLAGLKRLLGRLRFKGVPAGWCGVALALPPACSFCTTALYTMFGGDAPDFAALPIRRQPWLPVALGVVTACFVELGWRGFALPQLQRRTDALGASVALALLWAGWGLPLSLASPQPALWWAVASLVLAVLPGSILVTWLFNNTKGSLVPVIVFNLSVKFTDLLLAAPPASLTLVLAPYWLAAVAAVAHAGAARLSRQPLDPNCLAAEPPAAQPAPANSAAPASQAGAGHSPGG